MKAYLKIKIKSLAEESRMIRSAERKQNLNAKGRQRIARALKLGSVPDITNTARVDFDEVRRVRLEKKLARSRARLSNPKVLAVQKGLREHRLELRSHSRSAHLAYGFLRGTSYGSMEQNARHSPDWPAVKRLVEKFSEEGFQFWETKFDAFKESTGFVRKA